MDIKGNMMKNKMMGILVMGSMMLYEIMDNMMYWQHSDHEQHDYDDTSKMVLHSKVQQMDEMQHSDR